MKNIWIINSGDGPIYFSSPRKAYDYAAWIGYEMKSYSTYLKHLRVDGAYVIKEEECDTLDIIKQTVK